jgi:hypothetical protein
LVLAVHQFQLRTILLVVTVTIRCSAQLHQQVALVIQLRRQQVGLVVAVVVVVVATVRAVAVQQIKVLTAVQHKDSLVAVAVAQV